MAFTKLSRLRRDKRIRDWAAETSLNMKDIILPYFVVEGRKIKDEISSMPQVYRYSPDYLLKDISEVYKKGIKAVLLFGVSGTKDERGSAAYGKNNLISRTLRAVKKEFADLIMITDVCLCGYTPHGHCGIAERSKGSFRINHKETAKLLARIALSHAEAGADFAAPSAM
ncbi:MAG TPA: porphobilinogen synthase, partial [bacterium]|nr:porphobilinogen synthase [bacterium]